MSRQILDMSNDKLEGLFTKTNDNFQEIYQKESDQDTILATRAKQSDVDTLKARVDNLVATPGEATEGNEELLDIRVGYDGSKYPTAGDAVRLQVSELAKVLANKASAIATKQNLLNTLDTIKDVSINNLGIETANPGHESSRYFEVEEGKAYLYREGYLPSPILVVAFYSGNQFISRITAVAANTNILAPAGANRCRITKHGYFPINAEFILATEDLSYRNSYYYELYNTLVNGADIKSNSIDPSKLNQTILDLFELTQLEGTKKSGYYQSGRFYDNSAVTTLAVPVNPGEVLYYSGKLYGSAGYNLVTFFDNNNEVLLYLGISDSNQINYDNLAISVPSEASFAAFCFFTGDGTTYAITKLKARKFKIESGKSLVTSISSTEDFLGFNPLPTFDADYSHIICYGQSLSNGSDSLLINDPIIEGNYVLGSLDSPSKSLVPLGSPGSANQQHPIISAVNDLNLLINSQLDSRKNFLASSLGSGGQSIAQLMSPERQSEIKIEDSYEYDISTNNRYAIFLQSLSIAKELIVNEMGKSLACPAIIFLQGERDYFSDETLSGQPGSVVAAYACGGDKAKYKLYMSRLKDDMQNAVMNTYNQDKKPAFFIYQVAGNFVKNKEMTINMAQVEFAAENDDVFLLPSYYPMPNYSNSHMTSNGYRWYGEYLARYLYQALYQRSYPKVMVPTNYIIQGNTLKLKVANATLPLVVDTKLVQQVEDYGFQVYLNGQSNDVTSVKLYGDEIILYCQDSMDTGTVELVYAGMTRSGKGNIRDSDCYVSNYTYVDETNDKGSGNNLSIIYQPIKPDGTTLVGSHYPMYKWLQSFYIKLR